MLLNKIRILCYQEKYKDVYQLYMANPKVLEHMDLNDMLFFCRKKMGLLDNKRRDTIRIHLNKDEIKVNDCEFDGGFISETIKGKSKGIYSIELDYCDLEDNEIDKIDLPPQDRPPPRIPRSVRSPRLPQSRRVKIRPARRRGRQPRVPRPRQTKSAHHCRNGW